MQAKKDHVYIIGHKHPDTDSIVSAIAYAHLKQSLGVSAIAARLGDLNDETDYLLKRFHVEKPILLKDARASLDEIEMDAPVTLPLDATIRDGMDLITKNQRTFAVVDDRQKLLGVVTTSNLAKIAMGDTGISIDLLKRTSVENIVKAIDGKLLYKPKQFNFNGKTSIVAIAKTKLEHYSLKNRLVIIGNDPEAQIEAIRKGAAGIVLVWTDEVENRVLNYAKEKDSAVIISGHGSMNTSRYILFAPNIREIMTTDLVYFNRNEFVDDVGRKMLQTRFRSYPVIDDDRLYGFVSRYHILNSRSKKLILVDHNETTQSVDGVEHADVLEIIDHHRIGDLSTTKPIYFRNEIIGSTASIITKMYQEHGIEIPKQIASLLLSALISDTLNLKSPTTTNQDFEVAHYLESISGLERSSFAEEMYHATSNFKNKSYRDIINQDIKTFYLSEQKVMVSQVVVYHFDELDEILDDFEKEMHEFVKDLRLDLLVVVFTSVVDNGSFILSKGRLESALNDAFPSHEEGFMKDVVSRKNQIIPALSLAVSRYVEEHGLKN